MKIEKFTNDDFAKAAPLAAGAWGDFYADERQWFIDAVAEYILRYNYSNPSLALKGAYHQRANERMAVSDRCHCLRDILCV